MKTHLVESAIFFLLFSVSHFCFSVSLSLSLFFLAKLQEIGKTVLFGLSMEPKTDMFYVFWRWQMWCLVDDFWHCSKSCCLSLLRNFLSPVTPLSNESKIVIQKMLKYGSRGSRFVAAGRSFIFYSIFHEFSGKFECHHQAPQRPYFSKLNATKSPNFNNTLFLIRFKFSLSQRNKFYHCQFLYFFAKKTLE